MGRRKRVKWENGSVFAVPLEDESFGLVQAIDHWMPHWIYSVIFNLRFDSIPEEVPDFDRNNMISLMAISDDEFDFGEWPLVGSRDCLVKKKEFSNEKFKNKGYVGGKSYEGGVVVQFLSAYHKISPWDCYYKADYLDDLLLSPDMKPDDLIYKGEKA